MKTYFIFKEISINSGIHIIFYGIKTINELPQRYSTPNIFSYNKYTKTYQKDKNIFELVEVNSLFDYFYDIRQIFLHDETYIKYFIEFLKINYPDIYLITSIKKI